MEWTGQVYADAPTVAVTTRIAAPASRVWALVSDIGLMPELSAELEEVFWLDGATGPREGARFLGRSAHPSLGDWETVSTIVECVEPERFAWAVGDPAHPSGLWRFTLRPDDDGGTVLEQSGQLGPAPSGLSLAIEAMPDKEQKIVFVRLREFETGMRANLAAIKARAERER
ncbi:SRPBCC family protein [Actinocorallia sp. API 0066]|uniref:SRPBCC family protein n=1 Tax=Actinocorallia sp. API 0066 TaxID=2896846 RepID=UPI001E30FF13|nr:SRPBCC family protein [Actinocorallia sp. API 0066]MCD0449153.1 SRPBCC family protein [Actinocorallia sp. API 0066]